MQDSLNAGNVYIIFKTIQLSCASTMHACQSCISLLGNTKLRKAPTVGIISESTYKGKKRVRLK